MTKEYENILQAKRSIKSHIQFFETLIKHLNGTDKILRGRACFAAWCLHRYMNEQFMNDLQNAVEKNKPSGVIQNG